MEIRLGMALSDCLAGCKALSSRSNTGKEEKKKMSDSPSIMLNGKKMQKMADYNQVSFACVTQG